MFQFSTGGEVTESVMLVGRRTYEQLYSYWPHQTGNPYSEILKKPRKYVVSRCLREPLPWTTPSFFPGTRWSGCRQSSTRRSSTW